MAVKKTGLGKGLDSLIPASPVKKKVEKETAALLQAKPVVKNLMRMHSWNYRNRSNNTV